ncbi:MGMT family protein [Peribacillus cavernae]|uniref:MGMT family protein n=1 Tax=Peribacillus cavernae TaxID=1674310 RepID=A0A3S0V9A1_9BACI|nr:MGMT family protein [Peribacillus cavernae]MDQ0221002.1 methylated-DNA-protein-cysteine methyltransferase-like protein [Peribacillus cavernae]RUQ27455.1 MGMT family protein [Peribacillus cavernae]
MTPFTARVIEIIKSIPEGKVMTYGQIAKHAGSPRGARQVVRILHSMSKKHKLPWYRVINVKGEIAVKDDEANVSQKLFLQEEGIEFDGNNRINFELYQFHPDRVYEDHDLF